MYRILGADQKEYGPAGLEQLRDWIVQGRASAHTLVSFEGAAWKPLATFPELAGLLHLGPPPVAASSIPPRSGVAPTNSMSIAGLVFGFLGLACCPLIGSMLGLIFSVIGLSQIQKEPRAYSTAKFVPILGIVLALLGVVELVVGVMSGTFSALLREIQR